MANGVDDRKTHQQQSKVLHTTLGPILVEGPVPAQTLAAWTLDEGLRLFRPAWRQKEALVSIASMPEGRVIVARQDDLVLGYVTFHPPDKFERWGREEIPGLLELGAIEVTPKARKTGVGTTLIEVALTNPEMENYIVIATEYWWHWDLEGTGLTVWQYRQMLEKGLAPFGIFPMATDEPEICSHPANVLMVRRGKRVNPETWSRFEKLLFEDKEDENK